jgi:uncharacterized protein
LKITIAQIPDSGLTLQFTREGGWFHGLLPDHEQCDFTLGQVSVSGTAKKVRETIVVQGTVETVVGTDCSRCLEPAQAPVKSEFRYVFVPGSEDAGAKSGAEAELDPDDADCAYYEGEVIDLDPLIFEQIALQIPIRALCGDSCRGLCPRCGVNLNTESCDCPPPEGGKFAVLKNFKVTTKTQ